jgi:beta-ribofuranosylaminobenzene 5'-phosphate synthase
MSSAVGFARLHLTLIDVGLGTRRRYGGAGIALSNPFVTVEAVRARRCGALLPVDASTDLVPAVDTVLSRLANVGLPAEIRVNGSIPAHVGLGSKTATLLAILEAVLREYDQSIDDDARLSLIGRGGVSGIGVNATVLGGLIVDAGHRQHTDLGFAPSSLTTAQRKPPVNSRIEFPKSWAIDLLLPEGPRLHGEKELDVFSAYAPIPMDDSLTVMSEIYHGVLPAVSEGDLPTLAASLRAVHLRGFKRYELQQQPRSEALLEAIWSASDVAAGMSSMGPLVYAIYDEEDASWATTRTALLTSHSVRHLLTTRARSIAG